MNMVGSAKNGRFFHTLMDWFFFSTIKSVLLYCAQLKYFKKADFPNKVRQQAPDHSKLETSLPYQVVSDGGAANVNFQIPRVQWRTPRQV